MMGSEPVSSSQTHRAYVPACSFERAHNLNRITEVREEITRLRGKQEGIRSQLAPLSEKTNPNDGDSRRLEDLMASYDSNEDRIKVLQAECDGIVSDYETRASTARSTGTRESG